jgi:hypothetical protein
VFSLVETRRRRKTTVVAYVARLVLLGGQDGLTDIPSQFLNFG